MVKLDQELLFLYSENSRMKLKEMAGILKKSSQRIKYSLKVLNKEKKVNNPYCVFDYSYFGLILFRVYFKGGYASEKDKNKLILKLKENSYVVSIDELSGEFDLVVEMCSPNPSRFNKELKNLSQELPTLNNYTLVLNLVSHFCPRNYLLSKSSLITAKHLIIGGDRGEATFSNNEISVIKNLWERPLIRINTLARKTNLNVKTVVSVLKNLNEQKIIKGFKSEINGEKLGVCSYRLFFKLHNLNRDKEDQLLEYLLGIKECICVNKTMGDWNLEIDLESFDRNKIRYLILDLRETFKELISSFNLIEHYRCYQRTTLPSYLFVT